MQRKKYSPLVKNKNSLFIPVLVVTLIIFFEFWQIFNLIRFSKWVAHTDRIISQVHAVQMNLRDLESSERGFAISGDQDYLTENFLAEKKLDVDLRALNRLIQDNKLKIKKVSDSEASIKSWLGFRSRVIEARINRENANALIATGEGKRLMDLIMKQLKDIENAESQLRDQRSSAMRKYVERSSVVGIIAIIALISWLLRLISKKNKLEKSLKDLYEREQRAVQAREDTTAIVSHDLKNPLMSIKMGADLMEDCLKAEELSAQGKERVEKLFGIIHRATEQAQHLISDLLDFAKIESKNFSILPRPEMISIILKESLLDHEASALRLGVRLVDETQQSEKMCTLDKTRIRQVVSNLIGNALKFTPHGGEVFLRSHYSPDLVEVSIVDTGLGIPEGEIPFLFDRYYQPEKSKLQGTGLGLFITKTIVEAHGGKIRVQSIQGQGSTFVFTLPLVNS